MIKTKTAVSTFLVGVLSAGALLPAFAADYKPKTLALNPVSLRDKLLHSNFTVLEELNKVHQAKDSVMIARGNLLPKLNLGTAISAATGGPGFILSAITFLFPFLIPSNWANLHQSEHLLEAEKISYRLVELNQYASAYTIYVTVLADNKTREVLVTQYNDLVTIRDWLIKQRKFVGSVPQEDIDNADAQAKTAFANIANMDKLLVGEKNALMEMLGMDPRDVLTLDSVDVAASPAESMDLSAAIAKAQALSPESAQVAFLDKAAQDVKFSKIFGFMSGSSLNVYESGSAVAFNKLKVDVPFSIGFDYVPSIQLANDNIEAMRLRRDELKLHIAHLVGVSQESIVDAKTALASLTDAEDKLRRVYQAEWRSFTLGQTDLLHVLQAEEKVAQGMALRVKAKLDLDVLRIGLHREFISDQFALIPSCKLNPAAEEADKHWLRQIFRPKSFSISIDQACKPAN